MILTDRRYPALLTALLCLCLAACGEGGSSTPQAAQQNSPTPLPTRTPLAVPVVAGQLLPPAGTIYFGAYVDTSGLIGGNTAIDTASLEAQLGRTLALHNQYQDFLSNFYSRAVQDDFANYRIPVASINCGATDAEIVAGTYDATIKLKADAVKLLGWPVFVRYFWDPNLPSTSLARGPCYDKNTDDPGNKFSASLYIQAWQHVHAIFNKEGATNAIFLWSVNSDPAGIGNDPLAYYPGSNEVDWIGIDSYDVSGGSFADTYSTLYQKLAPFQKPIMITETGAPASVQPAYFGQAVATLKSQFPQVKGYMYYDAVYYPSPGQPQNQDWRIAPGAFPAFTAFANDPYMSGTYGR